MQTLYEDQTTLVIRYTNGEIRVINKFSKENFLMVFPRDDGTIDISAPNSRWSSEADGYALSLDNYQ